MAETYPASITFRDDKGQTSSMKFNMSTDETNDLAALALGQTAIVEAVTDLTNAAIQGGSGPGPAPVGPVTYGANAEYESIETKLRMTFTTQNGSYHSYEIPAPKVAVFMADGETVNRTHGDVATFIAVMTNGLVTSKDGAPVLYFQGGFLVRRKIQRKFNVNTLSPALTGPGL
jgi:hypothetical protein